MVATTVVSSAPRKTPTQTAPRTQFLVLLLSFVGSERSSTACAGARRAVRSSGEVATMCRRSGGGPFRGTGDGEGGAARESDARKWTGRGVCGL
jgi:hypothetical protein